MDTESPDCRPNLFKSAVLLILLASLNWGTLFMGVVGYTGSMIPTFEGGEEVLLQPAHSADPGDIIVFRRGDKFIIHRVMLNVCGCYITKGDNALLPDLGCANPVYKVVD